MTDTEGDRPSIDLDGTWRFVADPERLYSIDTLPAGEEIQVPGCWEAQVPRPYRIITAWYRRPVRVPADWKGGRVLLRFGAVMYRCAVWLNGELIRQHEGGYTEFTADATGAVRWDEENDLVVEVQNPLNAIAEYPALAVERVLNAEQYAPELPLSEAPHGKQTWYSSQSGIWKSVRAERVGRPHVDMLLALPSLAREQVVARWRLAGPPPESGAHLSFEVTDPDGATAGGAEIDVAAGTTSGETVLDVRDPVAWDLDTPHLYRLSMTVTVDGTTQDRASARFGMRDVATRDGFVTLNGRPIPLLGVLDQDLYPDTISTPPSRQFLEEQVRRAKELGFNVLRCHIKVPDPAYLEVADEAGMLVWCELPNWTRFTLASAARGEATMLRMVETMGNHPSIVLWTIINEDWGTSLRYEMRDRQWLRNAYDSLKALDPTRLVVDNSACETTETPNFHVKSDLADFHVYFGPDNHERWQSTIADFAGRPAWLWSPNGDGEPRGDEPLVLSEFGGWGLPRLDRMLEHYGREPWWFGTGQNYYRPSGIRRRFERFGLDRIWTDVDALAEGTQWAQFEALHLQITELRRHATIAGYVVTELTDAYWEANGVLDAARQPKAYHDRFADINAPDVVMAIPERHDLPAGGELRAELFVSSFAASADAQDKPGGRVDWELAIDGAVPSSGSVPIDRWPSSGPAGLGTLNVDVPTVERTVDAWLRLSAVDGTGRQRARNSVRLAALPSPERPERALDIGVHDPLEIWGIGARVAELGHRPVPASESELIVASDLSPRVVARVEAGARALVLVRSSNAVPESLDLRRRVSVHLRRLPHPGWPGQRSPWEGDWVSSFSWVLPGVFDGLPDRRPLDFAYHAVAPDHVLLGYDPELHRDEVLAGMFVGWVHDPAALVWEFNQGAGTILLTTFRLAPERGPVADALLAGLLRRLAQPQDTRERRRYSATAAASSTASASEVAPSSS